MSHKKPVIGICITYRIQEEGKPAKVRQPEAYMDAILAGGGLPVLFHPTQDTDAVEASLDLCDGLLAPGGWDIDPARYAQEKHESLKLIDPRCETLSVEAARGAHERGMPILGICLGNHALNVALGGTLIQDIPSMIPGAIVHKDPGRRPYLEHEVEVVAGTRIADIIGAGPLRVNSVHHQAIDRLAEPLVATAHAPDGVIEAIEDPNHPFFIGVQWHAEQMLNRPKQVALFQALVRAAGDYAVKRC